MYKQWESADKEAKADPENAEKKATADKLLEDYGKQNATYNQAHQAVLDKGQEQADLNQEWFRIYGEFEDKKKAYEDALQKNKDIDEAIKNFNDEKADYDKEIRRLKEELAKLLTLCPNNPKPEPDPEPKPDPNPGRTPIPVPMPDPEPEEDPLDDIDLSFLEEEPKEEEPEKEIEKEKEPEKKEKAPEVKKEKAKPAMPKPAKAKSNNPKTGIADLSAVAGTLAISVAGIAASKKKNN